MDTGDKGERIWFHESANLGSNSDLSLSWYTNFEKVFIAFSVICSLIAHF